MIERYTLPEMGKLWSEEAKFSKWLEIELLACEAYVKLGQVPRKAYLKIKRKARFDIERILELERRTQHDLVAFLSNLADNIGEEAKYLHYGMTSHDVEDTALSLRMREAGRIISDDLDNLSSVLKKKAQAYKHTPIMGRTHGVHAEPTSFGLKLALWYEEMHRNQERLQNAIQSISVGRIAGSVGNFAHISPKVEEFVCKKLGLKPDKVSTQILQRDRHADYLTTLAIMAGTLEKIALEIRNLQRTEILEVEEPFAEGQKGSSSMPHKRNPIICERICGLARVVRSNSIAALENMALWHERDITHSSVERVIIPDSCILLDYMLVKLIQVMENLIVYPERMLENIYRTGGLVFSQRILHKLIEKKLNRQKAYQVVQTLALKAWNDHKSFKHLLETNETLKKYLTRKDLESCFDLKFYTKHVDYIYKRVFNSKNSQQIKQIKQIHKRK